MAKATRRVPRASALRNTARRKTYDVNNMPQLLEAIGGAERIAKRLREPTEKIERWGLVPRCHGLSVYCSLQARNLTCHPKVFGLGGLGWRYLVIR